jgi:hypothetical protein
MRGKSRAAPGTVPLILSLSKDWLSPWSRNEDPAWSDPGGVFTEAKHLALLKLSA